MIDRYEKFDSESKEFESVVDQLLENQDIDLEPYFERGGICYNKFDKTFSEGIGFKNKYTKIRKTKRRDLMSETFQVTYTHTEDWWLKIDLQYGDGDGSVDVVWIKGKKK